MKAFTTAAVTAASPSREGLHAARAALGVATKLEAQPHGVQRHGIVIDLAQQPDLLLTRLTVKGFH